MEKMVPFSSAKFHLDNLYEEAEIGLIEPLRNFAMLLKTTTEPQITSAGCGQLLDMILDGATARLQEHLGNNFEMLEKKVDPTDVQEAGHVEK
jgi:hypothetical protein